MAAVRPFTKYAGRATCARDIAPALTAAVKATVAGRPGAAYVDLPSDVLMADVPAGELPAQGGGSQNPARVGMPAAAERQHAEAEAIEAAVRLLRGALRCGLLARKVPLGNSALGHGSQETFCRNSQKLSDLIKSALLRGSKRSGICSWLFK